jgi:hypothetical protein
VKLLKVFYLPTDAQEFCFKRNIKIYIKNAPTCFGRFPAHHQELNDCSGSLWFYLRIMVIVKLLFVVGPADPTKNTARLSPAEKLLHQVDDLFELYCDAWTYKP